MRYVQRAGLSWRRVWRWIEPPSGCQVRRLAGWLLLGFGVLHVTGAQTAGWNTELFVGVSVYQIARIMAGAALLLTNRARRLTWYGRMAACLACALCVVLTVDVYPAANGMLLFAMLSYTLLGEGASRREC